MLLYRLLAIVRKAATQRISVNHNFERRVGIWRAGFDADGDLFCNQRYNDWPQRVPDGFSDPWETPDWFPRAITRRQKCSYGKELWHLPRLFP